MSRKKEVIIVVPGAKYLSTRNSLTKSFVLLFYRTTRVLKPVYNNYAKEWADKFSKNGRQVIWLRCNRGSTIWSRWIGYRMLRKKVIWYKQRDYKVKVVGISLGGDIALRVLNRLGDDYIDSIILICSTNTDRVLDAKNTKVFNIYSPYDLFVTLMTKIIAPVHGGVIMEGDSVENISIENFSHDNFCSDGEIHSGKHKGKRITDLVNLLLE